MRKNIQKKTEGAAACGAGSLRTKDFFALFSALLNCGMRNMGIWPGHSATATSTSCQASLSLTLAWSDRNENGNDSNTPAVFRKVTRISQHIAYLKDFFRIYKDFTNVQIDTSVYVQFQFYRRKSLPRPLAVCTERVRADPKSKIF